MFLAQESASVLALHFWAYFVKVAGGKGGVLVHVKESAVSALHGVFTI